LSQASIPSAVASRVHHELSDPGYTVTNDQEIGLGADFHDYFIRTYFRDDIIRHDDGDMPADRQRARDVVHYRWKEGELVLEEHDTISITDRAGIKGTRIHSRVELLADVRARNLIETFLTLIPPHRRKPEGTFGVNLFRTFTNVVTKPHHDDEEFIFVFVLDRVGDGAETYLYEPDDVLPNGSVVAGPVFKHQLQPGEMIAFDDERFQHGATPLLAPPGLRAKRDALVCTVDYPGTYLASRHS
jgi:2OG-Fe dioxygenase